MKNVIAKEMNRFKEYVNSFNAKEFGTQFDVDGFNVIVELEKGKTNTASIFVDHVIITTVTHEDIDKVIEIASYIVEMEVM